MTTNDVTLLMNKYFDNEATDAELKELFLHLSESEESRTLFVDMKRVNESLMQKPDFEFPKEIDQKFAVLGMKEKHQPILSRQFTISVSSAIYSVGAVIVMSLFIYVMGAIQEKEIAERYRQTMNISVPYESTSIDRN